MLIGNGGLIGAPDQRGAVEIRYEVAPAFWNKGYAAEAARGLIDLAFEHNAVSVIAHSLAAPTASNAVMSKAGMRVDAEIPSAAPDAVGATASTAPRSSCRPPLEPARLRETC